MLRGSTYRKLSTESKLAKKKPSKQTKNINKTHHSHSSMERNLILWKTFLQLRTSPHVQWWQPYDELQRRNINSMLTCALLNTSLSRLLLTSSFLKQLQMAWGTSFFCLWDSFRVLNHMVTYYCFANSLHDTTHWIRRDSPYNSYSVFWF